MSYVVEPIAFVEESRAAAEDDFWGGETAEIRLAENLDASALAGLEEFSHVEVIFLFHGVAEEKIVTGDRHPRNNPDWPQVGIFAQRAKNRPNRLGSTICELLGVEGRTLRVRELDAIAGTPVLDLKPVLKEFLPRRPTTQPAWATELMERYWSKREV